MNEILNNNFKQELIVIASRPNNGKMALLTKITKDCTKLGKKVLLISVDEPKDKIIPRVRTEFPENLIVEDAVIKDLSVIEQYLNKHKPDVVIIDYLQLLPDGDETIITLKNLSNTKNIPIIVTSQLSRKCIDLDLSTISLDEIVSTAKSFKTIVKEADVFTILYHKSEKEYMVRELKNSYQEVKETDIRDILN